MSRKRSGSELNGPAAPRYTFPSGQCRWLDVLDILARDSSSMFSMLCTDVRNLIGPYAGDKCSDEQFANAMSLMWRVRAGASRELKTQLHEFSQQEQRPETADILVSHSIAMHASRLFAVSDDLEVFAIVCSTLKKLAMHSNVWSMYTTDEIALAIVNRIALVVCQKDNRAKDICSILSCIVELCTRHSLSFAPNLAFCLSLYLESPNHHVPFATEKAVLQLLQVPMDKQVLATAFAFFKDYAHQACNPLAKTNDAQRAVWFHFFFLYWIFLDHVPSDGDEILCWFQQHMSEHPINTQVCFDLLAGLNKVSKLDFDHPLIHYVFGDLKIIDGLERILNESRDDCWQDRNFWILLRNLACESDLYAARILSPIILRAMELRMQRSFTGTMHARETKLWENDLVTLKQAVRLNDCLASGPFQRTWWCHIRAIGCKIVTVEDWLLPDVMNVTEKVLMYDAAAPRPPYEVPGILKDLMELWPDYLRDRGQACLQLAKERYK